MRSVAPLAVLLLAWCLLPGIEGPDIPALAWQPRSDWIDVRRDVEPAARGDGIADDTAAVQAALDRMTDGTVVHLPAGTYRITATLVLRGASGRRLIGAALIGCGRDTRLVWDGPADPGAAMLWVKAGNAHKGRYTGLAWDGRGRAGVGILHKPDAFETDIEHLHQSFTGFTRAGISAEIGRYASAEILYRNCRFERSGAGVRYEGFNLYDNTFDGCEFRACGVGVFDRHGTTYVRNSHFEGSAEADLDLGSEHGGSVRRSTSRGSRRFLVQRSAVAPLTVQDCHVAAWGDPAGAIVLAGPAAPMVLQDCSFASPPPGAVAVVGGATAEHALLIAANRAPAGVPLLPAGPARPVEVPAGSEAVHPLDAGTSFLRSDRQGPSAVFDAKRDFGARGDGRSDDTAAVQAAIDAARSHGGGAVAYLPRGEYAITRTLRVSGGGYALSGCGTMSRLRWTGGRDGITMIVQDPAGVSLEHFSAGWDVEDGNAIDILHLGTAASAGGSAVYDGVYVYGPLRSSPGMKGFHAKDLSARSRILFRSICGNLTWTDAAAAEVLVGVSYDGNLIVQGGGLQREGFLGFLTRFSSEKPVTVQVRDNHSLAMSDYYEEQAADYLHAQGLPGQPPGVIAIEGAKFHGHGASNAVRIDGYQGLVALGRNQCFNDGKPSLVAVAPPARATVVCYGLQWYLSRLELAPGTPSVLVAASLEKDYDPVANRVTTTRRYGDPGPDGLALIGQALDRQRRLGRLDLELNHPAVAPASP